MIQFSVSGLEAGPIWTKASISMQGGRIGDASQSGSAETCCTSKRSSGFVADPAVRVRRLLGTLSCLMLPAVMPQATGLEVTRPAGRTDGQSSKHRQKPSAPARALRWSALIGLVSIPRALELAPDHFAADADLLGDIAGERPALARRSAAIAATSLSNSVMRFASWAAASLRRCSGQRGSWAT